MVALCAYAAVPYEQSRDDHERSGRTRSTRVTFDMQRNPSRCIGCSATADDLGRANMTRERSIAVRLVKQRRCFLVTLWGIGVCVRWMAGRSVCCEPRPQFLYGSASSANSLGWSVGRFPGVTPRSSSAHVRLCPRPRQRPEGRFGTGTVHLRALHVGLVGLAVWLSTRPRRRRRR